MRNPLELRDDLKHDEDDDEKDPFGRIMPKPAPDPEIEDLREPHKLSAPVGEQGRNNRRDVAKTEKLLGHTGDLDLKQTKGPTGYWGMRTQDATRKFQKRHGLKVDGQINPGGETIRTLAKVAGQAVKALAGQIRQPAARPAAARQVADNGNTPEPPQAPNRPDAPQHPPTNDTPPRSGRGEAAALRSRIQNLKANIDEFKALIVELDSDLKKSEADLAEAAKDYENQKATASGEISSGLAGAILKGGWGGILTGALDSGVKGKALADAYTRMNELTHEVDSIKFRREFVQTRLKETLSEIEALEAQLPQSR